MGSIEKNSKNIKKLSYDECYKLIQESSKKIIDLQQNDNSKNGGMDNPNKSELSGLYIAARQYAERLAELSSGNESATWTAKAEKFSNQAKKLGSIMTSEVPKRTMDDIKGLEDVKALIASFIYLNKHPQINSYYKIEGGMGLMMYGAPGTGKTMFAEAIANAMNLPLFIVTPADIFKSYVGASEQAVKQIFQDIESCIDGAVLFVDECESIFSRRDNDTKDYKAAVTNELLQRMNGMSVNSENASKRILLAATNRPDAIDPAYLRYKRFSHIVHIAPPDEQAKRQIITSKLKGIELAPDVTIDDICEMAKCVQTTNVEGIGYVEKPTGYYSAADICGIIEEASRVAISEIVEKNCENPIPLSRRMFEKAFEKMPPSISAKDMEFYDNFRKTNMF